LYLCIEFQFHHRGGPLRRSNVYVFMLIMFSLLAYPLLGYDKKNERTIHLAKVKTINGFACRGWITTTNEGRLISFDSAAPISIGTGIIPKGSRIVLFSNLKIQSVCLGKPTRIQGLPCLGYGPDSPAISFYPDGRLKACYLKTNTLIQGVTCHSGAFSKVVLFPSGKLRFCELAVPQNIQGQMIKARSRIGFDESGKLISVRKNNKFKSLFFDTLDKIL
jgi:hypothetical protein